jgi:hypothetical protein
MNEFDNDVDRELIRLRMSVSSGQRILSLLAAQAVVRNATRQRLRPIYPDLSPRELNLKVVEELERASERTIPTFAISA